tara:strand:- start:238 stop:576 length:339 start_codon:yes stop_codon:yes gene_type:complete
MSRNGDAAVAAGGGMLMLAAFALSILNVVAVWSLAIDVWHWPWFGAVVVLGILFMMRLDIILAPLALWGMIAAWGWPWWGATLVVFWPVILTVMASGADALFGVAGRGIRRV